MKTVKHASGEVRVWVVWCVKRKANILKDELLVEIKKVFQEAAQENGFEILDDSQICPDHVRLRISIDAYMPVQTAVKLLKNACYKNELLYEQVARISSLFTLKYFYTSDEKLRQSDVDEFMDMKGSY